MKFKVGLLFLGIVGSLSSLATPAYALDTPERQLLVTPLRNEITVEAGTVYRGSITLQNTGRATLSVSLDAEAFSVANLTYDYTFLPNSPINKWVYFMQDTITLDAGETHIASYTISAPNGAEPGGKYISLFASTTPSDPASITSTQRVGSLVYMTVPGEVKKTGTLLSLNSPLFTTGTSTWSATIQNSGTAHFRSNYTVELQTLWGDSISSENNSSLILPASVRLITGTLPAPQWIGIYKVGYGFSLGDTPNTSETRVVLYLPPLQLFALIAAAGLLTGGAVLLKRKRKQKTTG